MRNGHSIGAQALSRRDDASRAVLLALLSVVPLLVWWLGWFPGFLSSDSIDQLGQADRFEFFNFHPAFHSLYLWLITRFWDSPGAVTLVQLLLLAGLLGLVARRLVQVGVPLRLAVGAAWFVSVLPAVTTTTIAVWKDVPYTLALLWAFSELLDLARDPEGFWRSRAGPVRLGTALGLVWLLRHNGFLTVVVLLVILGVVFRRELRRLVPTVTALIAMLFVVLGVLYRVLPVETASIEPSEVFTSDVAASLKHEPGNFSREELDYLAGIAPLDLWTSRYSCYDSSPLVFDPDFKTAVIRDDPGPFRSLAVRTLLRDPDTVLGHRWCAASYLFGPAQPDGAFFHRPPFDIASNDRGWVRDPIVWRAYRATLAIYQWAEPDSRLWLTWRPALVVWAAALTYLGVALRKSLRLLLVPGALILAQLLNVVVTTPAQEFRFAFGIYVMGWLSLPLLWLVARPSEAALITTEVDGRAEHRLGAGSSDRMKLEAGGGE